MTTRIGIAGYMGAGKTTRARAYGGDTLVIDADAEAKAVISQDGDIIRELRGAFGGAVIDSGGRPRFDVLGGAAFESIESLLKYNGIVHPPVIRRLKRLVMDCGRQTCVLDAALIPLWKEAESWFDERVWIDAPFETRLMRLKSKRPDLNENELIRRMRLQEEIMPIPNDNLWIIEVSPVLIRI